MKKVKIKVMYDGPPDTRVDEKIEKAMASIGAVWWAQGLDMTSNVRDIAFDLEIDN